MAPTAVPVPCWAMLGLLAGLWKLAIASAALGFYLWRQGWLNHPLLRFLRPWNLRTTVASTPGATRPAAARTGGPTGPSASAAPGPASRPAPSTVAGAGLARLVQHRWSTILWLLGFLVLLGWVVARWSTSRRPGA